MPENENENVVVEDNTNDYIAQIKNLKENSVSKDDYNKLRLDNRRLIDALANGTQLEGKVEPKIDAVENINNLKYIMYNKKI